MLFVKIAGDTVWVVIGNRQALVESRSATGLQAAAGGRRRPGVNAADVVSPRVPLMSRQVLRRSLPHVFFRHNPFLRAERPAGAHALLGPEAGRPPLGEVLRNGVRGVRRSLRDAERGFRRLRKKWWGKKPLAAVVHAIYRRPVNIDADRVLAPRVLIIAETSIPQCLKYRVVQKQEAFRRLGIDCTWLSWTDIEGCRDALQTRSHAIFYRVPGEPAVLELIDEARRLGVVTAWETDDLIFDEMVLRHSRALARLDRKTFDSLQQGASHYRRAMVACDAGIASTPGLADAMRRAGVADVHVVENGLDEQTLAVTEKLAARLPRADDGLVRIVYGSGTNTHDVDFEEAASAIGRILDRFPYVRLRLIGPVAIPAALAGHAAMIERLPATGYEKYLGLLGECDISIAPLEDFVFNDAKSNIKYLEASALGVPSVCSPRAAFAAAITDGVDGLLCDGTEAWEAALASLVTDSTLRRRIGQAAMAGVRRRYAPERIARRQVAALTGDRRDHGALRILSVNIFYAPRSFGGATIVAENVNREMHGRHGIDVHVFTSLPEAVAKPYSLRRYEVDGIGVFGMGLPEGIYDEASGFDNPDAVRCFREVLDAVEPDVVHFHCVQGIGVGVLDLCRGRGIPYAVTLHDAWWLCGRQFMIDRHGHYCGQSRIDENVCGSCVEDRKHNAERMRRARTALEGAELLLTPSRFFADWHIANGFPHVRVNKNGITRPATAARVRREGPVRVGYVGGNTPIKGFHLVRKAFEKLRDVPATLVLVDNTLNLGFSSYGPNAVRGVRDVEVVPAYTTETIDAFFADIDVLLFPTQWKESFGLTVREAIARNVWVIATDAGGVVEDIAAGRNGTIIPFTDDGTALHAAILEAVGLFGGIAPGDPVVFHNDGVRYWEQQAAELASMLRGCVRAAVRQAA